MRKLDIPKIVLILSLGGFINSFGSSLLWPINSLFMHNQLGRSLTEAGFVMALQAGFMLTGQFLSGFLVDRYGARKLMLLGLFTASVTMAIIGFFPIWEVYAPGMALFGLAQAFVFVPANTVIRLAWPEGGRRGFNLLYVCINAGVAVGTAVAGLLAQVSFQLVFFVNSLALFTYFLIALFGVPEFKETHRKEGTGYTLSSLLRDQGFPSLLFLSGGIFLVWSAYIQLSTILPVEMNILGYSLPAYSILWTLNGLFIVILQPLINFIIQRWIPMFQRQFYLGSLLMGICFVILLAKLPYPSYILAIFTLTLGEMLTLPAIPAAAAQLAPKGKEGAYQGTVASAASGGRMLGPLLGGALYDRVNSTGVWLLSIGFLAASLGSFFLYHTTETPKGKE